MFYSLTLSTSTALQFQYFCDVNWKKEDAHPEKYPIICQILKHNNTLLFCDYRIEVNYLVG